MLKASRESAESGSIPLNQDHESLEKAKGPEIPGLSMGDTGFEPVTSAV